MPVKKAAPMPMKKATPKKKAPAKGEKMICEECGLVAVIEMPSLSEVTEELMCCGKPMKLKKTRSKKAPAAKKATTAKK